MISLPSSVSSASSTLSTSGGASAHAPLFNVVDVSGLGPPVHPDKSRSTNTTGGQAAARPAHATIMSAGGSSFRAETDIPMMNGQWPVRHAKGLLNGPGQNNCFLNCAVQVSAICRQALVVNYSKLTLRDVLT
uniref:Uncharacterized protein n=1 Tax=Anopheles maculatus TaxID=74869 RepID=A0A182SXZ0_9DIPT